jgi:hypothetical protein
MSLVVDQDKLGGEYSESNEISVSHEQMYMISEPELEEQQ